MKKLGLSVAFAAAAMFASADMVYAADMNAMVTKAAPSSYAPPTAACGSAYDFFLTSCPLSWYGVTFYGIIDMGGGYQTHATPFDPNFPTGASYFLQKPSRGAAWTLGPNGLSQSQVGFKVSEFIGGGWSFVSDANLRFDPYSLKLANAPQALQNAIGVPLPQQALPVDSSQWGWLAGTIAAGVSSSTYGTVLFGRQNTLLLDGVNAYDPMGGAYAFSPIGYSGLTCGSGDTEECRWTTAIKYRVNVGPVRFGVMGQPLQYGAFNPNNGAVQGDLGGDLKGFIPGVLSLDLIGAFEKDAVNIGPSGGATGSSPPVAPFPPTTYLTATISNNTSFMALGKYTINLGSVAPPPAPIVGKGPVPPPAPTGGVLTLYAGYEWIQFQNPSDPQSAFRDDGFLFANTGGSVNGAVGGPAIGNGTAINNNAYGTLCNGVGGVACSAKLFDVFWTGAKYGITKNLDIIGAYYHYIQPQYGITSTACANTGAHGYCAGNEDMLSAVLDWRFLPKWDVYVGTMFSQVNGGLANGYLSRNNLSTDAGVRFRF